MFTGELAESRQTEIIIHDVDEYAMELLIEFCYTSRIIVDEKNVQMLLPAACILQVIIKRFWVLIHFYKQIVDSEYYEH
jgi:kelch-like protein 20